MRAKNLAYCCEVATRLWASLGVPEDAGRVLASLLVNGGAATLSDVAAVAGVSLGDADMGCGILASCGAAWRVAGMKPGVWSEARDGASWRPFSRLRRAYRRGGLPAVREEYVRSSEQSRVYRQASSALERVCPVRSVLHIGAALEDILRRASLPDAASSLLSRLPEWWEIPALESARAPLRRSPLLVFGNHPSMLTPFLLAAALERNDLRILAHRYVTTLVPSLGPYVLPLEPTHLVSTRRRGLLSPAHALSLSALRRLDRAVDEEEARQANRGALDAGIRHVASGGALAIFPNGGRENGPWYPGLGRLVAGLRQTDALLVPVRETNSSNRRVYRRLRGRHRRSQRREPIRFYVGEPIPMRRLALPEDATAGEIARLLQSVYERTQWTTIDRIAALRTARGRVEPLDAPGANRSPGSLRVR
ncbi:MAG: hypothetical protein PHV11_08860 [Candidatus Bipolaricaulis sp.]|nr:hypothetical protein [Candidatus Bipolaricaulis sp.]